jgi:hypothetical protein
MPKLLGLVLFLGGAAALGALTLLGPVPETLEQWRLLRGGVRAIFFPCFFGGLVLTILAGIALLLQHPRMFARLRWFRLKVVLLVVGTPALHFWARGRMLDFDADLEAGRLDALPARWQAVGVAFVTGLAVYLLIGAIGRFKPRLGEPYGSRGPMPRSSP